MNPMTDMTILNEILDEQEEIFNTVLKEATASGEHFFKSCHQEMRFSISTEFTV